ncbi:hypothetical protein LB518_05090 [Mesorhizobium sp. BR1-1-16]|uniref:hypothetical protein n=1 Tax=Mesorhizobium sp. BR1-1-16 TaxID=2876653 RepID=UPI001CCB2141|nr:hypothetical protein [Mesorhizobium sp. BR1-1-16]MBZ9935655.1 hypothetical protein [Mesorhizobium sp. BR1-1-16]
MSSFLTSLAGMALGVPPPGAARLSLPPRYAAVPDAGWIETQAEGRAVDAARADPIVEPASRPPVETVPDAEPLAGKSPAQVSVEQRPLPKSAQTSEPKRPASITEAPIRIVSPEPGRPIPTAPVRENHPTKVDVPIAHPPAIDALPPRSRDEIGTVPPRAPLTAATVANRAPAQREPRPIVHVTIDRIDIRAPRDAAKAEPAPKRARAEPQISLADYLGARR